MSKGKYTEVRFDATINTGNYENEKLGVTYAMAEGENVFDVIEEIKGVVLGSKKTDTTPDVAKPVTKSETKTKTKKKAVSAPLKEVEEKESAPAEKPEKKVKPAATVLYDNKNDIHKARLGEKLDSWDITWKSKGSEKLKRASKASAALTGVVPFFDADGNILDSFFERFKDEMSKAVI